MLLELPQKQEEFPDAVERELIVHIKRQKAVCQNDWASLSHPDQVLQQNFAVGPPPISNRRFCVRLRSLLRHHWQRFNKKREKMPKCHTRSTPLCRRWAWYFQNKWRLRQGHQRRTKRSWRRRSRQEKQLIRPFCRGAIKKDQEIMC